jgi:lipoate-protein ligase A
LGKAEYKVEGGKLVKAQVERKDDRILRVKITGDFFIHPEEFLEELEEALAGKLLDESILKGFIRSLAERRGAVLLGVSPEDLAKCIVMAGEGDG